MTLSTLWNSASTTALFNHLWQSTVIVFIAWLVTLALRPNPARVRYWVWMFASVKFLVPFALLASLGARWAKPMAGLHTGSPLYTEVEEINQPFQQTQATAVVAEHSPFHTRPLEFVLPILAIVWLCGVVSGLAVWMVRRRKVARIAADAQVISEGREVIALRRAERNAGIRNPIPVLLSPRATEPGIFGVIRPVLLWPQGISERLTRCADRGYRGP